MVRRLCLSVCLVAFLSIGYSFYSYYLKSGPLGVGDFTKTFHVILGPDSQGIQVLAPYQYYMRKKNEESETVNITRVRDGEVLFTLTMDKDYFGIIEGAKMPVRFTKEGPGGTGVWTVFYHDDEPNAALLTGESKETEICVTIHGFSPQPTTTSCGLRIWRRSVTTWVWILTNA